MIPKQTKRPTLAEIKRDAAERRRRLAAGESRAAVRSDFAKRNQTVTHMNTQEERPIGSYRVVRCGFFDYWVQYWAGTHWAWVWPCMTKFGAVWFIVRRREMLKDTQDKETNAQTVWEE